MEEIIEKALSLYNLRKNDPQKFYSLYSEKIIAWNDHLELDGIYLIPFKNFNIIIGEDVFSIINEFHFEILNKVKQ